jgi:hypothetical protein
MLLSYFIFQNNSINLRRLFFIFLIFMPKRKIAGEFTARIIEALELSAKDNSDKMIADAFGIKKKGVESIFRRARDISGLHTRIALYNKAVDDGKIKRKDNGSNPIIPI